MAPAAVQVAAYFTIGLAVGLGVTMFIDIKKAFDPGTIVRYVQIAPIRNAVNDTFTYRHPMSHAELDTIPGPDKPIDFEDEHMHHDDASVAEELSKRVRVLCWVMTQKKNHKNKAQHVKATWGKRCNKLLFISDAANAELPTIKLNVRTGRDHLTAKTMQAFDILYKKFINDYDWFMKADDDTYVIVENLRYMLSTHSPTDPVYFGHHFKVIVKQGYCSGGSGYVLSREALARYGKRSKNLCAKDQGAEDVEMGKCMETLQVKMGDSRDALGRTRFHSFDVEMHLKGDYPDWYFEYDKYGATHGSDHISDYAISFHYMSAEQMYAMEYFVYHLRPFGILSGDQKLNLQRSEHLSEPKTQNKTTTR